MQVLTAAHHRSEIQGLRGIAVLLVVVYHTGVGLPGGFVGVDIFFVVSGYVIARLLLRELEATGAISLREFYARRARRLLPALVAVTAVTLGISLLVLSPFGEQQDAIAAARATALFGANLYFLRQQAYLELAENPLRHMWSLGVEEQFYALMPLLIVAVAWAARHLRFRVTTVLGVGVAISTAVSFTGSYLLSSGRGSTLMDRWVGATPDRVAFFSPATRAWEFGVGIACALVPVVVVAAGVRRGARLAWRAVGMAGGVGLAWSAVALDVLDRFPGTAALAPVLGTAALILASAGDTATTRVLSARWLTWIGDRSYGWYLWHWPFVVAAEALWPDRPWVLIVASIVALGPTMVSYAYLEQPIRRRVNLHGRRAVALGVACTAIPLALAWPTGVGTSAISGRPFEVRDAWTESRAAVIRGCFGVDQRSWRASHCLVGGSGGPIVGLVGDSHAASVSDGVIAAGREWSVAIVSQPGCPLMRFGPLGSDGCGAATAETLAIVDRVGARVLVIANAATRYVVLEREGGTPQIAEERRETYVDAYVRTVEALVLEGRRVVVILEVPTMTFSRRVSLLRPNPAPLVTPLANQVDRNEIARMIVERLGGDDRISIVDPAPILCPSSACSPIIGGEWAYMEASHLGPYGASLLSGVIGEAIDTQLARAAG